VLSGLLPGKGIRVLFALYRDTGFASTRLGNGALFIQKPLKYEALGENSHVGVLPWRGVANGCAIVFCIIHPTKKQPATSAIIPVCFGFEEFNLRIVSPAHLRRGSQNDKIGI